MCVLTHPRLQDLNHKKVESGPVAQTSPLHNLNPLKHTNGANPLLPMNDLTLGTDAPQMKMWLRLVCGFIYCEEAGAPSDGSLQGAGDATYQTIDSTRSAGSRSPGLKWSRSRTTAGPATIQPPPSFASPHFGETRVEVLHDLAVADPLAVLCTYGKSGIANHIQFELDAEQAAQGILHSHASTRARAVTRFTPSSTNVSRIAGPRVRISGASLERNCPLGASTRNVALARRLTPTLGIVARCCVHTPTRLPHRRH